MMLDEIKILTGVTIMMLLFVGVWMLRPVDRPWELWQFRGEPRGDEFLTWYEHDARDSFSTGAACLTRMRQLTTDYVVCLNQGHRNHDRTLHGVADIRVYRPGDGTITALWLDR
jgi:hypothetical protein